MENKILKKLENLNLNENENPLKYTKTYIETSQVNIFYDEETGNKIVNDYLFISTIGKGSYAKVKLCKHLPTQKLYAVKIINKTLLAKKKKGYGRDSEGNMVIYYMLDDALNEIHILKKLHEDAGHKNVARLYEIINDEQMGKIYLFIEHCTRGSIMEYNERTGIFSINKFYLDKKNFIVDYEENILKKFIKDLSEGLDFSKKLNLFLI
jgi:serine/threonine protein kinase